MRGRVVKGFQRGGRMLGFPTANLEVNAACVRQLKDMANWVFCGYGVIEPNTEAVYPMVMSVGNNPQFKNAELTVEVHFLHKFDDDFYGATVRIVACAPIREQGAFSSLGSLIAAIQGDCDLALKLLPSQFAEWAAVSFLVNEPRPEEDVDDSCGDEKVPFVAVGVTDPSKA